MYLLYSPVLVIYESECRQSCLFIEPFVMVCCVQSTLCLKGECYQKDALIINIKQFEDDGVFDSPINQLTSSPGSESRKIAGLIACFPAEFRPFRAGRFVFRHVMPQMPRRRPPSRHMTRAGRGSSEALAQGDEIKSFLSPWFARALWSPLCELRWS